MKQFLAAASLAAAALATLAACATTAPATPPAAVLTSATATGGKPCDPPMVVPASLVAMARAQFDPPGTPRPAVTPEDLAAYQKMQADQKANDWAALCYYRADNAALNTFGVFPKRVVFMGDSITQLWQFANPELFATDNINRGISGQTTPQMLLRFRQDVLGLRPKAVHILAGVNDIAGNTGPTTLEDIQNNIIAMVQLAKAQGVTVILATPLPADRFNWAPQLKPARDVVALAVWVKRFATENDLVLADYYSVLTTSEGGLKPELGPDGVHPNKAGYALMKPILDAAIAEALGR